MKCHHQIGLGSPPDTHFRGSFAFDSDLEMGGDDRGRQNFPFGKVCSQISPIVRSEQLFDERGFVSFRLGKACPDWHASALNFPFSHV
jgi:hypothetical protein